MENTKMLCVECKREGHLLSFCCGEVYCINCFVKTHLPYLNKYIEDLDEEQFRKLREFLTHAKEDAKSKGHYILE